MNPAVLAGFPYAILLIVGLLLAIDCGIIIYRGDMNRRSVKLKSGANLGLILRHFCLCDN